MCAGMFRRMRLHATQAGLGSSSSLSRPRSEASITQIRNMDSKELWTHVNKLYDDSERHAQCQSPGCNRRITYGQVDDGKLKYKRDVSQASPQRLDNTNSFYSTDNFMWICMTCQTSDKVHDSVKDPIVYLQGQTVLTFIQTITKHIDTLKNELYNFVYDDDDENDGDNSEDEDDGDNSDAEDDDDVIAAEVLLEVQGNNNN